MKKPPSKAESKLEGFYHSHVRVRGTKQREKTADTQNPQTLI